MRADQDTEQVPGGHRSPIDVFVLLMREDQVLMTKRAGQIPGSGTWALPSGKGEADEDVISTVRRELSEELGIDVAPEDVTWANVVHARPPDGDARVGFGFVVSRWSGKLEIREPDKCSALRWCALDGLRDLPDPVHVYTLEIVRLFVTGQKFAVRGWEQLSAPSRRPTSP